MLAFRLWLLAWVPSPRQGRSHSSCRATAAAVTRHGRADRAHIARPRADFRCRTHIAAVAWRGSTAAGWGLGGGDTGA